MGWLRADPRRLVALRVALEVLVALVFAASAGVGYLGLLVVAALRAWVALRAEPVSVRWESSVAAILAMSMGAMLGSWLPDVMARHSATGAWWLLPWVIATYALVMHPLAGLAFVALWQTWPFVFDPPTWVSALLLLTVVLAVRDRRWRLPLTWAVAGVAVDLSCRALSFDREALDQTGMISPHSASWVHGVQADMAMLVVMVIAGRGLLGARSWAVPVMVVASGLYALQPAPHRVLFVRAPNGPSHPLDAGQAHVFAIIAIVIALTWALPFYRALRAR